MPTKRPSGTKLSVPTEVGVKHEVYLFDFNPNHRWYYFSVMTTSEVLLFKCFDSNRK